MFFHLKQVRWGREQEEEGEEEGVASLPLAQISAIMDTPGKKPGFIFR